MDNPAFEKVVEHILTAIGIDATMESMTMHTDESIVIINY
jgi:hypothetical protein